MVQRTSLRPVDVTAAPPALKVKVEKEEKISIRERIQFETGKATLLKRSYVILDEVVGVMKSKPAIRRVRIEGYTDSVGSAQANLELSQKRAEAVMAYMVKKGIEARRLRAKGYGQERPVADNQTKEGRAQNRRVEFTIRRQRRTGGTP